MSGAAVVALLGCRSELHNMIAFCRSAHIILFLDLCTFLSSIKSAFIDTVVIAVSARSKSSIMGNTNMDVEKIRRADRAAHDVLQTHLREFAGELDLYPGDTDE